MISNYQRAAEFDAHKQRALKYMTDNKHSEFVTRDIEVAMGVSYNTARAILATLEREGKVSRRDRGNFNQYQYCEPIRDSLLKQFMRGAKMRVRRIEFDGGAVV